MKSICKTVDDLSRKLAEEKDNAIYGFIEEIATEQGVNMEIYMDKKMVAEALREYPKLKEKATARKPVDYFNCPSCGAVAIYPFCLNCGQKMDWSDD